jgi:hypothetical protein
MNYQTFPRSWVSSINWIEAPKPLLVRFGIAAFKRVSRSE